MYQTRLVFLALALGACRSNPASEHEALDASSDRAPKIDVCHVDEWSGDWHQISVAMPAVDNHLMEHGDWLPIEEEICGNLFDDDCDGMVDGGCTGCDILVTRGANWWADLDCALVDGVGIDPFPVMIGSSLSIDDGDAALALLGLPVGGDPTIRLGRQILAMKLNIAFFGVGDQDAVDGDGDGMPESYSALVAMADVIYDTGTGWRMALWADRLHDPNNLGMMLPTWLDDDCMDAMACGYEDDDQSCGCVEVCDEVDNDYDGMVDESCG